MTKTNAEAALLLALMAQWYANPTDFPPSWWNSPRQITAIAGQFNAPGNSDNDPIARLVQTTLIYVLLCAIYRANLINSRLLLRKSGKSLEIVETRSSVGFSGFFWVFSVCQMICPPTL